MAGTWRDFLTALVDVFRRPDQQALRAERRRAVAKLADQKIRDDQQVRRPER
ncbi:hypothetical protein [Micromonospora zingiberis]|uniref:hypothetical protein n=1 Tax=Micromonospora zingiberis TaxID=2053011 RepID=UPI0013F474B3|nr:hypothetical protein [Micromonospora zingiberis]